jgi:hypothetical protein
MNDFKFFKVFGKSKAKTHPHFMTHQKRNTWVIKASDDILASNIPYACELIHE